MAVGSARTLDALKTIGMNKYERNLWVALLSRGASTAGELSDISNVPRSRCYDVLESLADRGFVVIQPGKPMKYVAIHPKEAMERAKKKIQKDAVEMSKRIDRLAASEAIKELNKLHKETIQTHKPKHMTGALRGRQSMIQHMDTMLRRAKKSVKVMTTDVGLAELAENHSSVLKKLAASGVNVQVAAPVSKGSEAVTELARYAQVRDIKNAELVQKTLGRLFVVDGEEFLLGLTDDAKTHPTQDVALWTQSRHASANVLEPFFDAVWKGSKAVK